MIVVGLKLISFEVWANKWEIKNENDMNWCTGMYIIGIYILEMH